MSAAPSNPFAMDTPLGGNLTFRAMEGLEAMSRLFVFEVQAVGSRSDIDPDDLLGHSVTVHLETGDGENVRHWNGRVAAFEYVETGDDGFSHYRMTLRPWLWQLGLAQNCRVYQNMSVPDIVEKIFRDRGFSDFDRSLFESYPPREYVVQYRETDLQFVLRLLEREGIYFFFRHEDGKHTLVLADSPSAHEPVPNYRRLPYATDDAHRDETMQYVRRWRAGARIETGAYAVADFDFTKPRTRLYSATGSPDDDANASLEVYEYPAGFTAFSAGDARARLRLGQSRRERRGFVGESNARGLTVGSTFELFDHPREDQNGTYLVTMARLRLSGGDLLSGGGGREPFECSFDAVRSDFGFRAAPAAIQATARGPQSATVVGPSGQEIWTDSYGRIKVQFHWDRDGSNDEDSSCWVRVAQAWAGSGWGAQFIPRIGQEVIVEFFEGDPDRPIVTGCVYNAANMPPFALPSNQTQSGVKTRSSPGGGSSNCNEIRFEDAMGSEQLFVQAEKDLSTIVKNDESRSVGNDRSVSIGNDESLTVGNNRKVNVGADETIGIGGNETVTVSGNESVTVSGNETVSISGNESSTVGGSRSRQVGGSETVVVGGGQSITAPSQTITVGTRTKTVAGAESVTIGAEKSEAIGGSSSSSVAGSRSESVGGDDQVSVSGGRSVSIGKDGTIKVGANLLFDGADQVVIQSGDASITLKKSGDIVIKGKNVTVDASSGITVKAGSDIVLKGSKISSN